MKRGMWLARAKCYSVYRHLCAFRNLYTFRNHSYYRLGTRDRLRLLVSGHDIWEAIVMLFQRRRWFLRIMWSDEFWGLIVVIYIFVNTACETILRFLKLEHCHGNAIMIFSQKCLFVQRKVAEHVEIIIIRTILGLLSENVLMGLEGGCFWKRLWNVKKEGKSAV